MTVKAGTIISIVPDKSEALVVVELNGEPEPVTVAHNMRDLRARNLKRGDRIFVVFDEVDGPLALHFE